jgi:hypothetical protein
MSICYQHAERTEGAYREEIVGKVLQMCTKDKHGIVTDFAWYIGVLCQLTKLCDSSARDTKQVCAIADELIEITLRVSAVRPFAVECMVGLLLDEGILRSQQRLVLSAVLASAAWIVGEYASVLTSIYRDGGGRGGSGGRGGRGERHYYIDSPQERPVASRWAGQFLSYLCMRALLHPLVGGCLSGAVQAAYLVAAMKIFVHGVSECAAAEVASLVALLRVRFGDSHHNTFSQSTNLEVEEKKSFFLQLFYDLGVLFRPGHGTAAAAPGAAAGGGDLLEFPPLLRAAGAGAGGDSSEVTDEDRAGAGNARQKAGVLEVLFAEPFYPVHAKVRCHCVPLCVCVCVHMLCYAMSMLCPMLVC